MPLSVKQLANPHAAVRSTGGFLRLAATSVLERSFFDPLRADERNQWWESGVVARTLADPIRGTGLVGVVLERHERRWQGATWTPEERLEWEQLWTHWCAALAARGASPDEETLDRAWSVAAMACPDEAVRLVAAGADPHRPFVRRPGNTPTSGWNRVLSDVCSAATSQHEGKRSRAAAVSRVVGLLESTWEGGDWHPFERERALATLWSLTWSAERSAVPAWALAFRTRLLAEGASPLLDIAPSSAEQSSALALWWRGLGDDKGRLSSSRASATSQEWGEALVAATTGSIPVAWGALAGLPEPAHLMQALLARGSVPWNIIEPSAKPLFRAERRPMRRQVEAHSAKEDMQLAMGWTEPFEVFASPQIDRPLDSLASWLESWHVASPGPTPQENAWRDEAFSAWLDNLGRARATWCVKGTSAEWTRVATAWRSLMGSRWVPALHEIPHEQAWKLPAAAWSALLRACSPGELGSIIQKGFAVHSSSPPSSVLVKDPREWISRQSFVAGALGHLLVSSAAQDVLAAFLTSASPEELRPVAWEALLWTPPAALDAEVVAGVALAVGAPWPEHWRSLVSRGLVVNPRLAAILSDDAFRSCHHGDDPPRMLVSAWASAGAFSGKAVPSRSGQSEYKPAAEWADRRTVLVAMREWGVLEGTSTALLEELGCSVPRLMRQGASAVEDLPSGWVDAVEALVDTGGWEDDAPGVSEPLLAPLIAHARARHLRQELPSPAPLASRPRL